MRVWLCLLIAATLAGCGYKGPLYLPESKAPAMKPVTVVSPEPAPDRPLPAEATPPPK